MPMDSNEVHEEVTGRGAERSSSLKARCTCGHEEYSRALLWRHQAQELRWLVICLREELQGQEA